MLAKSDRVEAWHGICMLGTLGNARKRPLKAHNPHFFKLATYGRQFLFARPSFELVQFLVALVLQEFRLSVLISCHGSSLEAMSYALDSGKQSPAAY